MTTIQTHTETEVELELTRYETIDIDFARELSRNKNVPEEERTKLKKYLKKVVNGNQVKVDYVLGKNIRNVEADLGRLVPVGGLGLQCFKRNVRNALAGNKHFDIDVVNCAPTLLTQLAERHGFLVGRLKKYVEQREELLQQVQRDCNVDRGDAKAMINKVIFGGSTTMGMPEFFVELSTEMRQLILNVVNRYSEPLKKLMGKKSDRSKFSYIYQTEERKVLLALDKALQDRGRSLDVFIHDGGLVRRKDNETTFPVKLLRECEAEIEKTTGYKVSLLVKPMETDLERAEDSEYISQDIIVDDVFAARKFAELLGDHIVRDGNSVWLFDMNSGIWTDSEEFKNDVITKSGTQLVFRQVGFGGVEVIHNYSGVQARRNNLKAVLQSVLPNQKDYFKERIDSDLGKCLFKNGIYDCKTASFQAGFDSEIVFNSGIPRDFPTQRNPEKEAFVRKTFFEEPFRNPAVGKILLHYSARAILYGDYKAKKAVIAVGPPNSSKGTYQKFLTRVCGSGVIGSFNGDSLLLRSGDNEATKALSWVKKIAYSRASFSQEITLSSNGQKPINGNLFKSLTGGGDEISLRLNFKDEEAVVNKSIPFIMCNGLPPFSPNQEAIKNRIVAVPYSFSFVEEPVADNHKPIDRQLDDKLRGCEEAFINLMIDELKDWNGKEPELPAECKELLNEVAPVPNIRELLEERYDITRNPDDWVETRDILNHLKQSGMNDTDQAIGRQLTDLGLLITQKKIDRQTKKVRLGIKEVAL